MNRIACAIIAVIIIAFAIVFDACIIALYSPTTFLTKCAILSRAGNDPRVIWGLILLTSNKQVLHTDDINNV